MTLPNEPPLQKLQFYATTPYNCGYITDRMAQSLIAAPHHLINANTYSSLIQLGFRRSGKFIYRPHCEKCNACIPVRLPVDTFTPNRSQLRAFKKHEALSVSILALEYHETHYQLYIDYQAARHASTESDTTDQYRNFLVQSNIETILIEFKQGDTLKMVSVVDIVEDGISAVYTFYDTTDKSCSYGTFNVLWLAQWCRSLQLPYLYLGYWIKESQKMTYKQNFQPQQALVDGEWQVFKRTT